MPTQNPFASQFMKLCKDERIGDVLKWKVIFKGHRQTTWETTNTKVPVRESFMNGLNPNDLKLVRTSHELKYSCTTKEYHRVMLEAYKEHTKFNQSYEKEEGRLMQKKKFANVKGSTTIASAKGRQ